MLSGERCQYCGLWVLEPCPNALRAAACADEDE